MGEGVDTLFAVSPVPFIFERVLLVIGFDELWSMDLVSWFPGVICFRVVLPFDQVLEGSRLPRMSVINDLLDLIFFFSFNKVWGWSRIVRSMHFCLAIK